MKDFNFTITNERVRVLPCGCKQYILTGHAFQEVDREIEVRWWEKICGSCYFTGTRKQDKSPSAQWYHERKEVKA